MHIPPLPPTAPQTRLRDAAEALETSFLAEMLKSAGLGRAQAAMGGTGSDEFSTFLLEAQAREMVKAGGIGLAESLYQALAARGDHDAP
ncbi:rod-binding protein [Ketogulonicigenium vulgare]|uniref:Peptidoglycan hydrolase flgJ n=1 Tax=Ketogulonicigenium vulgare (strain WSH-001) TaxID=759362 RepID=F9Y4E9_KETVW|nr:rod-binding protein [Ketogulonicigenium vulgare]ADO43482.1 flagellar protein FlgJ, putative [Ketogulonicigenium vulgare Y25]AEM41762.1 Peptidoglycan hydrolase flgJ [Ketogulonicigenium vulgare WSH-001]ALJ82411.1 flagellar biosynthesis protein FlgJ [Ketogulonicigenium vulgare]ANW35185.1 flagellar biosynthesis protein FlgJ [Ketogulonicigenium vulgare]